MRLLKAEHDGTVTLTEWLPSRAPKYAILSHTWGQPDEEVTFQDVFTGTARTKKEYRKIDFCREQAVADGLQYFWVDTCCINKSDHSELSEAINSMFRWYQTAEHCYIYLSDVSKEPQTSSILWETQFRRSRWFTRGWTLQELLAPVSVKLFSVEGVFLGNKITLENEIAGITKIKIPALRGSPLEQFSVHERMNWSDNRQTTKEEDAAYCLLGIFDVFIPLIYGEGKSSAKIRLLEAIDRRRGVPGDPPALCTRDSIIEASQVSHLMVPFGQNSEFVGRKNILKQLVGQIRPTAKKNDCQRTVLEGLGGVGKTQIALEAAYRMRDEDLDCSVFWVPAINMVTFENAYREIGNALGTPGIDNEKADVKTLVKIALEKSVTNWLLIIDNVDDISLLAGTGLQDYLPFNRKGSILFTTRNHEVAVRLDISTKNIYTIDGMSEDEALELLQNSLKERQFRDVQATRNLLRHLVYLPLAVKQATAYMARTQISTAIYLKRCLTSDETQMKLLNAEFEDRWRYSKNTNPITITWLISFQHLAKLYPLAIEYLKFICFLADKDIPISLLPPGQDEEAEKEALGILEGYAFITVREQTDSFDVHRLVRLATQNWIKGEWAACCKKVIQHLAEVYPFPKHENRQVWTRYMPHTEMVLQVEEQCIERKDVAWLLNCVAGSYAALAKYERAQEVYRQTLEINITELGAKHPNTLHSMNNLALVLRSLGKYEEAEQMQRQTLQLSQEELGAKHPNTLHSMNNLTLVLQRLGKYEEAEQMQRQTLQLNQEELGLKHPFTLTSMNNLANILTSLGKDEEAEQMQRQTLQLNQEELGLKHPSMLTSMNNLALVLESLGKYEEAEQMHR